MVVSLVDDPAPAVTTRRRRLLFVDRDEFQRRIAADGFLEWTEFFGTVSCTAPRYSNPPRADDVLLEIEVDGAAQVQALPRRGADLPRGAARAEQEQRLRARGDDPLLEPPVGR